MTIRRPKEQWDYPWYESSATGGVRMAQLRHNPDSVREYNQQDLAENPWYRVPIAPEFGLVYRSRVARSAP